MKKLILLLALIGIVLTSCENGNDVDENNGTAPSVPQIELAQQIVEVEFEPNEYAVSVTSPYSWEAKSKNDWLILKTESGIGGTKDLKFSVKRNEEEEVREGTIVIQNESINLYAELYVTQKSFIPEISLSTETLQYEFEGGTQEITITSNFEYDVIANCDWIDFTQTKKGISLTVEPSPITEVRSTEIVVLSEKYEITKKIKVEQKEFEPSIEVDITELEFEAEGGYKYITINANSAFSISKNASWISYTKSDNSIKITVSASTIMEERSADVTIYLSNYNVSKVVKVTQKAFVPTLSVDVSEVSFDANGGSKYAYVTTNATYSVTVDANWITYTKNSNRITITATASTIVEERNANIIITLPNYGIEKTIKVSQGAFEPILTVENISTLEIDYNGGERNIHVESNFDYTIDCSAEWIIYEKSVNGIKLTVAPNYVMEPRTATLTILGAKYNFSDKVISITQTTMPSDYTIIEYTTDFGGIVTPYDTKAFGKANIISNTYENGNGILKFDIPLTTIGSRAFYGAQLSSITIPETVTKVDYMAFGDCTLLKKVYIRDLSAWCKIDFDSMWSNPIYYGAKLVLNGQDLTDVTIPLDVSKINEYAFINCSQLTSVVIHDGVSLVGEMAFYECTSLSSVKIGNSVTAIEDMAFKGCTHLTDVHLGTNIVEIGKEAFYNCSMLTSVFIPNNVKRIYDSAFFYCKQLTSIYCSPTTPPSIRCNPRVTPSSFPFNSAMKIYVPRNSYSNYMQYSSRSEYELAQTNWSGYESYIEPYDFE
jgi:hypothetical protein